MSKTNIVLKIDQNGGEYYGFASITLPTPKRIEQLNKTLTLDDVVIEFDENFQIVKTLEVE